jgi:cyanophycinase
MYRGTLIPIGGNEDKGQEEESEHEFVTEGILSQVVKESGGEDALILIVPTASMFPKSVGKNYKKAFKKLGCTNIAVYNIDKRSQCEKKKVIDLFTKADCVFFSGGDQSRIVDFIANTTIHQLIIDRLKNEKFVLAGTSAGAMSMSAEMIMGGSSSECMIKGAVKMREGMGYVDEMIIDSHFVNRGRFGRLAEAVAQFPKLFGVGLAEDTGLIIKEDKFEVIGSGMVIILDPSSLNHNNHEILEQGLPMTMANLTTHILACGDSFSISERFVEVMPLEVYFNQ